MYRSLDLDQILSRLVDAGHGSTAVPVITGAARALLSRNGDGGFDLDDLARELTRTGKGEVEALIRGTVRDLVRERAEAVTFHEHPARPPYRDATDLFYRIAHAHEGTPEERRARYAPIAELVRPGDRVVDIGCGDGTFLELVRERGAEGIGIDVDPEKVERVREKGFAAHCGRAQELDWGEADFVSMLHIVEHIPSGEAVSILDRVWRSLSETGRLFLLTPNIAHPTVQTNFWLDVTHVRPYPRLLLDTLMEQMGFPYSESGTMTLDLESWCYGFKRRADGVFGEEEE